MLFLPGTGTGAAASVFGVQDDDGEGLALAGVRVGVVGPVEGEDDGVDGAGRSGELELGQLLGWGDGGGAGLVGAGRDGDGAGRGGVEGGVEEKSCEELCFCGVHFEM